MTKWTMVGWGSAVVVSIAVPRIAGATPAGIFVSESAAGTVVRIGGGGDLDGATRFATGLGYPQGICVGPGGELYVAERDAGEITIITAGGDFADAEPWAFGTWEPVGLACNASRVLVVDAGGRVVDAGDGGDVDAGGTVFASGLLAPVDLLARQAIVWVSGDATVNISAGGDFTGVPPHATGAIGPIDVLGVVRLGGSSTSPRVLDWGAGGDLEASVPFATLPGADTDSVDGLLTTSDGRLLALVDNAIYDAAPGGDLTAAVAIASGLHGAAAGYEGMIEHLCEYNADCDDQDVCTGVESCADEVCIAGRAMVCDDGDGCTVDACDPVEGCSAIEVPGCCTSDDECAGDEICDVAARTCVPLMVPGDSTGDDGGTDDGAGESDDGASATTEPTPPGGNDSDPTSSGDDSSSGGAGGAIDEDAGGCGCTQHGRSGSVMWSLLALPLLRRRRR